MYWIHRSESKFWRCESSRRYQKEIGKLKNNNISIEYKPIITHWQWQRPRNPPECSRKYLDPKASAVESRTCNIEGQVSLLGKQANRRPNVWCTTSMKTREVAKGQCIKYKGPANNRKDAGTLEADGKLICNSKALRNTPVQHACPHTTLKGRAPRHVLERLNKGEQTRTRETEWTLSRHLETIEAKSMSVNSGCKAYAGERVTQSLAQVFNTMSAVLLDAPHIPAGM